MFADGPFSRPWADVKKSGGSTCPSNGQSQLRQHPRGYTDPQADAEQLVELQAQGVTGVEEGRDLGLVLGQAGRQRLLGLAIHELAKVEYST